MRVSAGFAPLFSEVRDFFHGQDVAGISFFVGLGHRDTLAFRFVSANAIVAGPVKMTCDQGRLAANRDLLIEE